MQRDLIDQIMDKFVTRNLGPSSGETSTTPSVNCSTKRMRVEFSEDDIIHDQGKHKSIDSYDVNIRDQVRITYLLKGSCQPKGHEFPQTHISCKFRSFKAEWFDDFDWLKYSTSEDATYCFYCYLFKKVKGSQSGGDVFISKGFENWKKACATYVKHVVGNNSSHVVARKKCEELQNQRQSVSYLFSKQDFASQNSYRIRLTVTLKCVQYLLGQGLPFRGHDESKESISKGNFLELDSWVEFFNKEIAKHVGSRAPRNNHMLAHDIQLDMVNSCASSVVNEIIKDICDSFYALLVDEDRDSSVQEQNGCGSTICEQTWTSG